MLRALMPAETRPGPSPRTGGCKGHAELPVSSAAAVALSRCAGWPALGGPGVHQRAARRALERTGVTWLAVSHERAVWGPLCYSHHMDHGRRRARKACGHRAEPDPGYSMAALQVLAGCGERMNALGPLPALPRPAKGPEWPPLPCSCCSGFPLCSPGSAAPSPAGNPPLHAPTTP